MIRIHGELHLCWTFGNEQKWASEKRMQELHNFLSHPIINVIHDHGIRLGKRKTF